MIIKDIAGKPVTAMKVFGTLIYFNQEATGEYNV
jgi:hypothetical protein